MCRTEYVQLLRNWLRPNVHLGAAGGMCTEGLSDHNPSRPHIPSTLAFTSSDIRMSLG